MKVFPLVAAKEQEKKKRSFCPFSCPLAIGNTFAPALFLFWSFQYQSYRIKKTRSKFPCWIVEAWDKHSVFLTCLNIDDSICETPCVAMKMERLALPVIGRKRNPANLVYNKLKWGGGQNSILGITGYTCLHRWQILNHKFAKFVMKCTFYNKLHTMQGFFH